MRFFEYCRNAGLAATLVIAAAASPPAVAAPCGGFTDVDDTNPAYTAFCANVQWVKNRSITLGCTTATLYCPAQNVTRIQMAAFMNRVGDALTPQDLGPVAFTSVGRQSLATPPILCQNPSDYAVTGFPRRAMFNSKVNVYNPSADVELVVDVMYSTAGGVAGSWISVTDTQTYQTLRATGAGAVIDDVSMYPIGFLDLVVGSNYRFGIRVTRVTGTGDPFVYCVNRVAIENRTSATAPFDEPERTGRAAQLPPQ